MSKIVEAKKLLELPKGTVIQITRKNAELTLCLTKCYSDINYVHIDGVVLTRFCLGNLTNDELGMVWHDEDADYIQPGTIDCLSFCYDELERDPLLNIEIIDGREIEHEFSDTGRLMCSNCE